MDVQPGHCWFCEKLLPQSTVPCEGCPVAVYCTTPCRDRDNTRHRAVECEMFQAKKCSTCGKLGNTLECSRCNDAWYCDTDCQQAGQPFHKAKCKESKAFVKQLSLKLEERRPAHSYFPYYIGNTMAKDFLQLENNELSTDGVEKDQLARGFIHVLSAGCGNLRNTVLTAASLPGGYQGQLCITINDYDPFVMARNVLFIFMLVRFADTDYIASSLTTIWYSLHISKREYDLIKMSLDELAQLSAEQLNVATREVVFILNDHLSCLKFVWGKWRALECQRDKETSINLKQQRKVLFDDCPRAKVNHTFYLSRINEKDRKMIEEWLEHGLFCPNEMKGKDMPFDNPTLTAPKASKTILGDRARLQAVIQKDDAFVYCIKPILIPFEVWDCLKVRQHTPGPHSSPMVMYHKYVTNLFQKVKSLILQRRLVIHVVFANCLDFAKHHQTSKMPSYDRIFTSNLADYIGFAKLLQTFKPLLNTQNSYSAIVTETMNWLIEVPEAKPEIKDLLETQLKEVIHHFLDSTTGIPQIQHNCISDYVNNTSLFLQYLRANIMAGGRGIPPLKKIPSFGNVKRYHGMEMRDFRKRVNKLVPFYYQVNKRDLNVASLFVKAVEWCLPKE